VTQQQPVSQVRAFREQQALEEQAAHNGLYGVAIVANHASIVAHMERAATHLIQLFDEGKHEEALRLMETPDWGLEGEQPLCPTTTNEGI
jgi:hypothetical protein